MCDNLNTTDIVETECYLCPDQETCNRFSKSYINRCNWKNVFPKRCSETTGVCDGICDDGMDYVQAGFSPFVSMVGWFLFIYGLGWLRKERGKFAMLRRHGVQITADVVGQHTDTVEVPTAVGLPDLTVVRFWATVQWVPEPPPQATWKGMLLHPRRGAFDQFVRRNFCWCSRKWQLSKHALKPWQRIMDKDGQVKVDLQLTETAFNAYREGVTTLRIAYDPFDDQNWVLPVAALGEATNRLSALAIMILLGLSLVAMGTIMTADVFHCGPHLWGFPECCDTCLDWSDISDTEPQKCWRGGCDGVGGKSHLYWCSNGVSGGHSCYIGWSMVPIPIAMSGISFALVVVFQKNNGVCRVGSQCDNLMGFFCGEGKFCCPDQPPRMHRRDTEEPESQSLLDYTGASGHL